MMLKRVSALCLLMALVLAVPFTASVSAQEVTETPNCPPMGGSGTRPTLAPGAQLPAGGPPAGCGGGMMGMGSTSSLVPAAADVAYATLSDAQKLDIYLPEGDGPFPLVIFIHGGGFMMGDKGMGVSDFEPLVAAGYAVATINYRLSGEALFPAQIQDAKAAVRFLRANAETYNLDPENFAAWGASAGGNLVALLGTSGDVVEFDDPALGNADVSSRVQAVVDWFGPVDFLNMDAQFAADSVCDASAETHDDASSPESMLVGAAIQDVPEIVAQTNPATFITEDDAPFFIQHGTADCNVPTAQSQNLYDALVPVLGEENVTLTLLEGAGHGTSEFSTAENLALVVAFLDQHLKAAE